jgi:hypothetical protein
MLIIYWTVRQTWAQNKINFEGKLKVTIATLVLTINKCLNEKNNN